MTEPKSLPLPTPIPFPGNYNPSRNVFPNEQIASRHPSTPSSGTAGISGEITLTQTLRQFASFQKSKGLADTTVRNRDSILRTLAARSGRSLMDVDLYDLRDHLGRPSVAAGTRRTERGAMVAFFSFAHQDGLRSDNPALRLSPISAPKGQPRPFTNEQIDAMLASGAYRRTRAMILIGYYQGFRVSQIAAVHGHDIDLMTQTIRTVGKGSKEGVLPLHPIIAELAKHMPADDWWFPARSGRTGHVSGAAVTNLVTNAKKRAGILDPNLTPHSLRHAFGTDLVESGVDIRVVQELMMHASLATTQIYTGVSARLKREGIGHLAAHDVPVRSGRVPASTPPLVLVESAPEASSARRAA